MEEAIRILEKHIEMLEGLKENTFMFKDYVQEQLNRIPKIQEAIDFLKEAE